MPDFLMYFKLGWEHIISLDALDHQLFVMALIVAFSFRDLKKILILITAFTVGHSLTLALSVLDLLRIPSNWVEFLIPVTILLTALENLIKRNLPENTLKVNYLLALFFGLVHGLGFANTVRMMLAQEQSIAVPLLGFNIGLEIGQILVVLIFVALGYIAQTILKMPKKDWVTIISSGILALALQMCLERLPF